MWVTAMFGSPTPALLCGSCLSWLLVLFFVYVQCHQNGMKVGMKNAIELLGDLSDYYDFAINEECHQWNECGVSASHRCHGTHLQVSARFWETLKWALFFTFFFYLTAF